MKKELFYKWAIALLILLNLSQIGLHFYRPKPPHHPSGKRHFKQKAVGLLKLDKKQKELFHQSAKKHGKSIDSLILLQKDLTTSYFNNPMPETLEKIKFLEGEKLRVTQINFNEIELFLYPNQKEHFKTFKKEALGVIIR